MRSELPIFGSSSRVRMRWAGMLVVLRIVAGPAANRILRMVQLDPNLMVALLLDIGWRVAQQVLSMDLFTDLGNRIFEGVLLQKRVLAASGITSQNGERVFDHGSLYSTVDFLDQRHQVQGQSARKNLAGCVQT